MPIEQERLAVAEAKLARLEALIERHSQSIERIDRLLSTAKGALFVVTGLGGTTLAVLEIIERVTRL